MADQAEQHQKWWQQIKRPLVIGIIAVSVLLVALLVVEVSLYGTGFAGKTLWDWLQLLGILAIPVVAGFGAVWFTGEQRKAEINKEKRAEENYQLQRFYTNIYQAYNDAKRVKRLLRATAQYLPPNQSETMILIEPYSKQMQALVDIQLQFETFVDEIKSNPKPFSTKVSPTMKSDLETLEQYLNQIIDEYEALYKKHRPLSTTTTLPLSELVKLKSFIGTRSFENEFFIAGHRVRDALRERLISEGE